MNIHQNQSLSAECRHEPSRELGAHDFDERRRHYTVDRLARGWNAWDIVGSTSSGVQGDYR
jgi:hypothetical protein